MDVDVLIVTESVMQIVGPRIRIRIRIRLDIVEGSSSFVRRCFCVVTCLFSVCVFRMNVWEKTVFGLCCFIPFQDFEHELEKLGKMPQMVWKTVMFIFELGKIVSRQNVAETVDWKGAFEKLIDLFEFFLTKNDDAIAFDTVAVKAATAAEIDATESARAVTSPLLAKLRSRMSGVREQVSSSSPSEMDKRSMSAVAGASTSASWSKQCCFFDVGQQKCDNEFTQSKPCPHHTKHLLALLKQLVSSVAERDPAFLKQNIGFLLDLFGLPDEVKSIVDVVRNVFEMIKPLAESVSLASVPALSTAFDGTVVRALTRPASKDFPLDGLNEALSLFSKTFAIDVELVRTLIGLAQIIVTKDTSNMGLCLKNLVGFAKRFGDIPADKVESLLLVIQFVQDTSPRSVLNQLTAFVAKDADPDGKREGADDTKSEKAKSAADEKQDLGVLFDRFDTVR